MTDKKRVVGGGGVIGDRVKERVGREKVTPAGGFALKGVRRRGLRLEGSRRPPFVLDLR